jgi:diguanylate cyclase (GGDEF)-like protein
MHYEPFEELKSTGKLPSPSGVGLRILVLTRSGNCSLEELTRTLQADPALTGRILKLANSVLSGGLKQVTSAREAGVRLGLRTVCNVALGFSLVTSNRSGQCAAFGYDAYWSWSLANAVAAEFLSRSQRRGAPSEAFTLGLLARVGSLALASVYPAEFASILLKVRDEPGLDPESLEREAFCISQREVGAALAEDWGLPAHFSEVLLHHGRRVPETVEWTESQEYLRLLEAAGRVAEVLVGGSEADALWPAAREALVDLGAAREDCQGLFDGIVASWREWGQILNVPADYRVRAAELEQAAAVAPPSEDTAGLRVLAVDDEPTSLRLVTALLEQAGHQVVTAKNGQEALNLALANPPQMVVTDWMMPGMDGLELCKRLRSTEAGQDLYILILTGQNEEQRIVEAFEAGADDHLAKPLNARLLLARLRPGIRVIRLQEHLRGEVREKEEANRRLAVEKRRFKLASMTDALTELPNRRYAMKRLEKEWATSLRTGLPLSVILLDIDHFKSVNDTYGHDVGDRVLCATARAIGRVLRTSDTCTRMGGEEFLVITPGTHLEGASQLAERIRAAIEVNDVGESTFAQRCVTVSLGVACSTLAGVASIDALLKVADEGVYRAKRSGRNRVALPEGEPRRKSA